METHSPQRYTTHCISATTPVLFCGIFLWVTSLNVAHWSKGVMHTTHMYLQSTMTSSSQWPLCCESAGWPTGWLVNSGLFTAFSHELSQKVLMHYNHMLNIVIGAITNKWMSNNARELYIWYNFEIVPWNRTKLLKLSRVIKCVVAEILVV